MLPDPGELARATRGELQARNLLLLQSAEESELFPAGRLGLVEGAQR